MSVLATAKPRASPGLPPAAFVSFLQNHDQVGNRALGERIHMLARDECVRAALAIVLLAPSPPLLFMGEEFAAATPFLFFCDFEPTLAKAVTQGRRDEFRSFAAFADPDAAAQIPDPSAPSTYARSKLDWRSVATPPHDDWMTPAEGELARLLSIWVAPPAADEPRLNARTLRRYLAEHLSEPFELDAVARHFGVSRAHLSRAGRRLLGEPLGTVSTRLKLEFSRALLEAASGEFLILDVARRVG